VLTWSLNWTLLTARVCAYTALAKQAVFFGLDQARTCSFTHTSAPRLATHSSETYVSQIRVVFI